jgi:Lon protease-like protein
LLGLRALGRDSFRLEASRREPDGLYIGRVTWLPEPTAVPLPPQRAPLVTLLRSLIDQAAAYRDLPRAFDDAGWVAARLAEILPLSPARKQALLAATAPRAGVAQGGARIPPPPDAV